MENNYFSRTVGSLGSSFVKNVILLCLILLSASSVRSQNVTVSTSGGATWSGATSYATLAAAVTELNNVSFTLGGTGTVTFSYVAASGEAGPAGGFNITRSATSSVNVVIDGGSKTFTAGANTAGSYTDAVIKLTGADYITIQNFTIRENGSNSVVTAASNTKTEFGIALFNAAAGNGAQNNIIQNNNIQLDSAYPNTIGIYSNCNQTAATSSAGTNAGTKVYGNTISNVQFGAYWLTPAQTATVQESGIDVGGSSASTANTITFGQFNGAFTWATVPTGFISTTYAGLYFRNTTGVNVRYNTISNPSTYSLAVAGVMIAGTTPASYTYTSTISNNAITLTNTGITAVTGVDFGFGLSTGTIAASSNSVTINQNATAANSAALIGIKANYASATNTILSNTVIVNQSQTTGATTSAVTGITAAGVGTTVSVGNSSTTGNTITIKQSQSGAGSYGSGAIRYIDVNAASATINVMYNTLNTTGSTIRSTGALIGIFQDSTVTTLVFIDNNTMNVDRVAASGSITFQTTSGTPSEVKDTITNNSITITGLTGASTCTAISSLGGPSTPAANNKTIDGNTISVTGTHSGTTIGITCSFTNTGFIRNNSVTLTSASATLTGITTTGSNMTMSGNTLNLNTSVTSLTSLQGIVMSGTGTHSITNNTFTNLNATGVLTSGGTTSGFAISGNALANLFGNTITNISVGAATSTGSPIVDGILISGGTSINVYKNKIYGISTAATGTTTAVNGIRISGGTTNQFYNNLIGGLTASAAASTDAVRGIAITATSGTNNVYNNTINLSASSTGANFGASGLFYTTGSTLDLRNNIVINTSTPAGTGIVTALRFSSTTLTNFASTSNRNLFFAGSASGTRTIMHNGTTGYQDFASYLSFVGAARESLSFAGDSSFTFVSTTGSDATFLKPTAGITTQAESGASSLSSVFTDDFGGSTRPVTPGTSNDIGAWEFAGITPAPSVTLNSVSPTATTQCTAANRTISVDATTPAGTSISSVVINYSHNGTAQTAVTMSNGGSGNTYTGQMVAPTTTNATVAWTVTATNSLGLTSIYSGTSFRDEPTIGYTGTASISNATVCSGSSTSLSAKFTGAGTATLGTSPTASSSTAQSFLPGGWGGAKTQYIVLASELTAAGVSAGNLSSIAFTPTTSGQTYQGFQMWMGTTTQTAMTTTFIPMTGQTQMYLATGTDNGYTPSANTLNTLAFGTGSGSSSTFTWDGTSNIVLTFSWSRVPSATTATASSMNVYAPGFTCSAYDQSDSLTPAAELATATADGTGTSRPVFVFAGVVAVTPSSVSWSNGTSTVGSGNPLVVNPTASTTYTATGQISGCGLQTSNSVTVTTNALPDYGVFANAGTNSSTGISNYLQCGPQTPSAGYVTDGNGYAAGTSVKWYSALTGGSAVATSTTDSSGQSTYPNSISANTTFYVSVADPTSGCESSPRTQVDFQVSAPATIDTTGSTSASLCLNGAVTLAASSSASPAYSYTWSSTTGSGITTALSGANQSVTPTVAGTYTYTVNGTNGTCNASNTVVVTIKPLPTVNTLTASTNPVCSGGSSTITALVVSNGTGSIGAGASTSSAAGESMFPGAWGGAKTQYLIRASELTAAGFAAGPLTSLSFSATTSGQAYQGFALSIGHTSLTTLAFNATTPMISAGLSQVYAATGTNGAYTPIVGTNTLTFGTGGSASSFNWDGTSNIILSFCWSSNPTNSTSTGSTVVTDTVSYQCSTSGRKDSTLPAAFCPLVNTTDFGTTVAGGTSIRPRFTFAGLVGTVGTGTHVWSWKAGSTTISGATANTYAASPTATTVYNAFAQDNTTSCIGTNSIQINVNPLPTAPSGTGSAQCGSAVPTASVSDPNSFTTPTFKWYAASTGGTALQSSTSTTYTTAVATTTDFWVSVTNPTTGCESTRTQVSVAVSNPVAISTAGSSTSNICLNGSIDLAVSSSNSNYTYSWAASPSLRSGLTSPSSSASLTVTPIGAGTYTYTVTATDTVTNSPVTCYNTSTVVITVVACPTGTATVSSTATCNGVSVDYAANFASPGIANIGSNTSSTITTTGVPYRTGTTLGNSQRNQYLISAAELATGGFRAGNFTALSTTVTTAVPTGAMSGLTFKMANVSDAALTTTLLAPSAMTTVLTLATYSPVTGENAHSFTTPFTWDGTSNVLIEICGTLATTGSGCAMATTATTFNATVATNSTTGCSDTTGTLLTNVRPVFKLSGNTALTPDSITWYNSSNASIGTGSPLTYTPSTSGSFYAVGVFNGASKTTNNVSVTVNPIPATPATASSSQCGSKVPTVSINDTYSFSNPTFTWYNASTGGTALQATTSRTYTSVISADTTFYVSVKDPATGCESGRNTTTVSVSAAPAMDSLTGIPSASVCPNVAFTPGVTAVNYNSFTWTASPAAGSGIPTGSLTGSSQSITPTAAGTYTYTVQGTSTAGCGNVATFDVTVTTPPAVSTKTATPSSVCVGSTVALAATSENVTAAVSSSIGSGILNNTTTSYPTPFGGYYFGSLQQYLIPASELRAAGLRAGNLTSIAFDIVTPDTSTLTGYTIGVKHTGANTLTTAFGTGFTTVYSNTYTPSGGTGFAANTIAFTTPFNWDGSSNILVSICFNNTAYTNNAVANLSTTSYNSSVIFNADSSTVCGTTTGGTNTVSRPNMKFGGQIGTDMTSTRSWTWSKPSATDFATTNTTTDTVSADTTYTVKVTDGTSSCFSTSTVAVTALALPTAPTASNSSHCGSRIPTASVSDPNSFTTPTFKWYAASTGGTALQSSTSTTYTSSVGATTSFYVSVTNPTTGCESARTQVDITVTAPPAITLNGIAATSSICGGSSVSPSVSSDNSSFAYTWTASPATGSGIATSLTGASQTITPTIAGTYTYTVIADDTVCPNSLTFTVTRIPTATVASSVSSYCVTGGTPALTLSPATGYGNASIQWATSTNGTSYTDVSSATSVTYTPAAALSTSTYFRATVSSSTGTSCSTPSLLVPVYNPVVSPISAVGRCGTGTVNISATVDPGITVNWYDAATGGNLVFANTASIAPTVSANTTYYAEPSGGSVTGLGLATTSVPASTGASAERGMVFTASSNFTLQSAQYYSPTTAVTNTVVINLTDNTSGTLISTKTLTIAQTTAGWYTMNLGFSITPGTTYRLTASFSQSVNRDGTTQTYPIAISNVGSISSGYDTGLVPYLSYFHNLTIVSCIGSRVAASVVVNPDPSATTIAYGGSPYCSTTTNGNVALSGTTGGSFTVSPSTGLTLNGSTGAVTPSTSTPGTYTVTYTLPATTYCSQFTTTATVVVNQAQTSAFNYGATSFCADAGTISATLTGGGIAGTFGSSSGLTLNGTTGAITLGTSTAGTYNVTNTVSVGGCVNSVTSVSVTVNNPVVITAQPLNQSKLSGDNASFSVTATATGIGYQWQVNTGSGWNNVSGATTSSLAVNGVTTGMNGDQYRVLVSGTSPCSTLPSDVVTLTVGSAAITADPTNQTACSSGNANSATFGVTAVSGSAMSYQWQENRGSGWSNISQGGIYGDPTGSTFTLSGVSTANSGWLYRVKINSDVTSNSASLTVRQSVDITVQPVATTSCTDTTVNISVTATGDSLTYQWQVNTGTGWTNLTNTGVYTRSRTTSLRITNPTFAMNNYQYQVIVSGASPCSSVTSTPVVLTVNSAIAITTQPASSTICNAANAAYSVVVTGTSPTYQWQSNTGSGWNDLANGSGYSGVTSASLTFTAVTNAMSATQYRVNIAGATACSSVTSNGATLTVSQPAAPGLSTTSNAICNGDIITLTTSPTTGTAVSGTGAVVNTSTTYPAPYSNYYGGAKHQMLFLASELAAMGFASGSQITSIGMSVSSVGTSFTGSLSSFQIAMANTATTTLSTTAFEGSLTTVLGPITQAIPTTGLPATVTHTLATPFTWNGTSNVVIQVAYNNGNAGTTTDTVIMLSSNTSTALCNWYRADSTTIATILSTATPSGNATTRPNVNFGFTKPVTWSAVPSGSLYTNSTATTAFNGTGLFTTLYAKPSADTVYTTTATNALGCTNTSTQSVAVSPVSVGGSIAGSATLCSGFSVSQDLTLSGHVGTITKWQSSATSDFASATDITNATTTQSVSGLTATRYYRAVIKSGVCSVAYSATAAITINANVTYYLDGDTDGYGNGSLTQVSCFGAPSGYVANSTDCNDDDATINASVLYFVDADQDGYGSNTQQSVCSNTPTLGYVTNNNDCNDNNVNLYTPITYYVDNDGDGFGSTSNNAFCQLLSPSGYSSNNTDCNDGDNTKWRSANLYRDTDGDGYAVSGSTQAVCYGTSFPSTYISSSLGVDCNDGDINKWRTASFYADADNDTYTLASTTSVCYGASTPTGYRTSASSSVDCDDSRAFVYPGAPEICGNGIDDNCDGNIDDVCQSGVSNTICGTTLSSISSPINAIAAPNAVLYKFEVTNLTISGSSPVVYTTANSFMNISLISGGANYATKYSIRVAVDFGSGFEAYSSPCTVTTPTSNLINCNVQVEATSPIYFTAVSGATGYRVEVTNGATVRTVDVSSTSFTLSQLSGAIRLGTEYSVRIAPKYGSAVYEYGSACSVFTGTTALIESQCGVTLANLETTLYVGQVATATRYRIESTNTVTNAIDTLTITSNFFNMTQFPLGVVPTTTYRIRVAAEVDGSFISYGKYCSVTTPAPTTRVVNPTCGSTLGSVYSAIYAAPIAGATQYRFQVTNNTTSVVKTVDTSVNNFDLTQMNGVTVSYNTFYTISVAVFMNGIWQPYGDTCQVKTPTSGTPTTRINSVKCGGITTLSSRWETLYCGNIVGATGYSFYVTWGVSSSQTITSSTNNFTLMSLTGGAQFNTTYTITVAPIFSTGVGTYGGSCIIATGATRLSESQDSSIAFSVMATPNPFENNFSLAIATDSPEQVSVMVYDMLGKEVENRTFDVIDVPNVSLGDMYASGVYNVIVTQGDQVKTVRIIKR
ncbi:MAG: hypothetical protein CFE24_01300 [Flavobacterium sp. BFFFF2]|nr:MAG: hypothetical protein CFE24_01300 [Flavobacterium sp. BFFFF2]